MIRNYHSVDLNKQSLSYFRTLYESLAVPKADSLAGTHKSEFVGPGWLRLIAGPGLVPLGLGGWWGKKFNAQGHGMNIVKRRGELLTTMPVRVAEVTSLIDGELTLAITYERGSHFPWPWVLDEVRRLDDGTLLGMTMIAKRPFRQIALPFLLHALDS
jgi:hypothetical protein